MGIVTFQLPTEMSAEAVRDLERAAIAGGPDNMPWPTQLHYTDGRLAARKAIDESGHFVVPWQIPQFGRLMTTTATLMERAASYNLVAELARGKVNQVRNQVADWVAGGLQMSPALQQQLVDMSRSIGHVVTQESAEAIFTAAPAALTFAFQTAQFLVQSYIDQVFTVRGQRGRIDTALGCRLGTAPPSAPVAGELPGTFNSMTIPMSWARVEAEETVYRWRETDALVTWAQDQGYAVVAGPLIDFSAIQFPGWLWTWERDVPSMATFMCRYVEAAIRRYRNHVRRWQITAGSNSAALLGLSEDELLGLTYRLVETARQVDSGLELTIGVSQPWGEYLAQTHRTHSPFIFADTLIRSGLNLAALDVEMVMGVAPRGSYCRDVLEASRLLDMYSLLGVPLRVTAGCPSSSEPDREADPEMRVDAGHWRDNFSSEIQAEWASAFISLALCKPAVQTVQWAHLLDTEPHQFPNCGLVDATGALKPAFTSLRELRERYL